MSIEDYQVFVRVLDAGDGGGYFSHVPDLAGCMSDGDTPEEAIANARDAIGCWIEAAEEMGHPVPSPSQVAI